MTTKPEKLFYVQDIRGGGTVGNVILWWAKDHKGYTCHLDKAHVFKEHEIQGMRDTDRPWPKDMVDVAATLQVDHQYLQHWDDSLLALTPVKQTC